MKKVAVIGAGITGLSAAYELKKGGYAPLLFEAGKRAGGMIQSERSDEGFLVEHGPNTIQDQSEEASGLFDEVDLRNEIVEARPASSRRYILRKGKPVPIPTGPLTLLSTKALSLRGKLRLLAEPFVSPPGPDESEESIAAFVRRRLGQECLDYLVDPFVSGIFAGDPEKLSVRHALPRLYRLETTYGSLFKGMRARRGKRPPRLISFSGGLGMLPQHIGNYLGNPIYLETTAETLAPDEGGWKLVVSRYGRRLRDRFDAVVFAIPALSLAELQVETGNTNLLSRLTEIDHAPVASLSLGFRRDQVAHPLDGFGLLAPRREKRDILGILFSSSLFPGRAPDDQVLLTIFVGGVRQPEMIEKDDETLVDIALAEARCLLGVEGVPTFRHVARWPRAIPQSEIGHQRFMESLETFEKQNPGLFVAGAFRDGISVNNCIAGGLRHGQRARAYLDSVQEPPSAPARKKRKPSRE